MKPLIVMALESEGQGQLEALGFEVLYCGVGKVNAAYHLTRRLARAQALGEKFSYVLNMGSAGSPRFGAGSLVAADRCVQRDMDASGLGFVLGQTPFDNDPLVIAFEPRFTSLEHGVCGSGDSFLQGPSPVASDIIDMEAYALAKVCLREQMPFACVKYITDGADADAALDWQEQLVHSARAFSELLAAA
jgi:adenosylhomocysteine nucleosidase